MTNQSDLLAMDERDRELIRTNITENYFVEASAGSGKTTSLVDRMTALVKAEIPVRQICAITFTKNAAAEFYFRFQKKLSEEAAKEDNSPQIRKLCRDALNEIDLAFMGTIDAFCNLILHEHPAKAQIPGDAELRSDNEIEQAYAREYANIVNGEYSDPVLLEKAEVFAKIFDKPKKQFLAQMKHITELRHTVLHYPEDTLGEDFSRHHMQEIADLAADLTLLASPEGMAFRQTGSKDAAKKIESFALHLQTVTDPKKWDTAPLEVLKTLRDLEGYRILPDAEPQARGLRCPGLFSLVESARTSYYELKIKSFPLFQALCREVFGAAFGFFARAAEPVAEALRSRGELTYFDNLLYLRDMLRADASDPENGGRLIRYITKRHRYFLIDEFQDTNPLQAEIFFYLAAEHPAADWRRCVPRPGSLFIVGDPKQSIYRFRNADVQSFLNVRALFQSHAGCRVLTLRQNFRSEQSLCAWFNECFTQKMPVQTENQSVYEEIPAGQPYQAEAGTLSGVFTYRIQGGRDNEVQAIDVDTVCRIIRGLTNHPAYRIQTRKDKAPRPIRYSDFMVIGFKKNKFISYVRELAKYGIPTKVEGTLKFSDCPALMSLAAILNAAANPYQADAVYRAWTCPLTGLTAEDLLTLRQRGLIRFDPADLPEKIAETFAADQPDLPDAEEKGRQLAERLNAFQAVLDTLAERARTLSFPLLVDEAIRRTDLFAYAGTEYMEYLCYAQELVRSETANGNICSAQDGAAFLIGMIDAPEQERSLALDRKADCVHFANLHKVKGLERPIVILAVPYGKKADSPDRRTEYGENGADSWFFEIENLRLDEYEEKSSAEKAALDAEDLRLLYVAATRAKCALIIADRRTSKKDKVTKDYEYSSASFWSELAKACSGENSRDIMQMLSETEITEAEKAEAAEQGNCLTYMKEAKACSFQVMTPSRLAHAAAPKTKKQERGVIREKQGDAALTGTMVHRLMECIVSSHDAAECSVLCADICREYDADAALYAGTLETVFRTMHSGGYPQDETGDPDKRCVQDLLPVLMRAEEVCCELPFSYLQENGELWYGVIDLVYCLEGRWHIVDYKTNEDGSDLDKVYRQQLEAYRDAFRRLTGQEADVRIYHIAVV